MDNNFNYNPYENNHDTDNSSRSNDGHAYYASGNGYGTQQAEFGTDSPKRKPSFGGFGMKLTKCAAIALVFGAVAGTAFCGVSYFAGGALGIFQQSDEKNNSNDSGKEFSGLLEEKEDDASKTENGTEGEIEQSKLQGNTISTAVTDVSDVVENAMPCVVAISNLSEVTYQGMWGQQYSQENESCGTGFIVEQDEEFIYIATNNHVVQGAKELTVQFSDDTEALAEIKGTIATKDLAVIKVALSDISAETRDIIRVASLGDSTVLEMGEGAIAIGNALGYGQSVTTGVISALGRSTTVKDETTGTTIICNNLIQTNAAINPGNSGGPLLNAQGEVIGINSIKYADTDVEGIGYAIPISDAMVVIEKLISGQQVETAQSGYLGIQGKDIDNGVYVYKVFDGSAAEKAGIRPGDIIVGFEGNAITTMSQLKELLSYYASGEEVEFAVYQVEGNEYVQKEITVVLGDSSSIQQ
uniref:S1C family serine protease n=1 Tax=Agathobacter sp. TaxID=2021311 RepID=UPI0040572F3D